MYHTDELQYSETDVWTVYVDGLTADSGLENVKQDLMSFKIL